MSHSFTVDIGGLRFRGRFQGKCEGSYENPLYEPFVNREGSADPIVEITLSCEPPPPLDGLPLLFDTGTWRAYGSDGAVFLVLPYGKAPGYLWVAHLGAGGSEVTVFLGPHMIDDSGGRRRAVNPLHYPLDQILTMFVLASHRGVIVHAAGVAREGQGIVCAGRSGAGKTTLMRQWRGVAGLDRLSDDRVIIRRRGDAIELFGTPWAGEGAVAAWGGAHLKALTFIHQSERNELRALTPTEAMQQLLPTASIVWFSPEVAAGALDFCHDLTGSVPAFELHCRPDESARHLLDELFGSVV